MSEKKQLNQEEIEKVTGGYDFKFYDYTFTENAKVKDILADYPWVANLYPELQTAAKLGLTVGQACLISGVSYETLQATLSDYESKYYADGTPKTGAIYG